MKTLKQSLCLALALWCHWGVSVWAKPGGDLLTRSLYIPIEFKTCKHLQGALLYESGQAVAQLPTKRIFLFTYYPHLGRIEPEQVRIRIEGSYPDRTPMVAKLAVTMSTFGST